LYIAIYSSGSGTSHTDFITGFTNKDDADAAAAQIKKDFDYGYTIVTSVIRIA
jgi:hypothetical protein